jgi:diacylglycerol O-acyltransferase / wax synthase
MKRLSGADAAFLYMETPSSHMHVAGIGIYDPSTATEPLTRERLMEVTSERLHLAPLFRERLATIPFGLHHPLWVDDPDYDLEYHIRSATLPAPGGPHELAAFAADQASRPLDRDRPLWEMVLIDGLEDGNVAVFSKTHHAAIDGVSGVDLTVALMDLTPDPPPPGPIPPWTPERVPTDLERVAYAAASLARQPLGFLRASRALQRSAGELLRRQAQPKPPDLRPPPAPFQAPRTSLNVSITPHRSFAFTELPLDDLKAIKNTAGGTVNDVVLAICAGTLRRWFDRRGESLAAPLVASVPVSVRTEEQKGELGNRISFMLVSLATDVDDPAARLATISAGTRQAKEQQRAIGADALQDWAEFAAPAVAARAARLYSRMKVADRHRPIYNLTISNVPGPQMPLYSLGARLVATYPMGPINEGAALNITVTSYLGRMMFGFHGCREVVDDPWFLATATDEAAAELSAAVQAGAGAGAGATRVQRVARQAATASAPSP